MGWRVSSIALIASFDTQGHSPGGGFGSYGGTVLRANSPEGVSKSQMPTYKCCSEVWVGSGRLPLPRPGVGAIGAQSSAVERVLGSPGVAWRLCMIPGPPLKDCLRVNQLSRARTGSKLKKPQNRFSSWPKDASSRSLLPNADAFWPNLAIFSGRPPPQIFPLTAVGPEFCPHS